MRDAGWKLDVNAKEEPAPGTVPSPANDHGSPESRAQGALDPRIRIVARAIGRRIAREHYAAWERKRRRRAANDNAAPEREEEGRKPEG